jgi:uncharacterized protein YjbJ (UPF0337 family)
MNKNILEGNWKQLKGEVRKQWGKLTDDDVDKVQGSAEKLIGTVQERYGKARSEAADEVSDFLDHMENRVTQS